MEPAVNTTIDELVEVLNEIRAGQDFTGSKDFFEQGLLDSLDLTALVAAVESKYHIFLDIDEINQDNFRNLDRIQALLNRKAANS